MTSTRGPAEGKFAFTSHEAGDHQICLSSASSSADAPQVRMHLDVVIGEARPDNSAKDRAHITDLAGRVRLLNDRLRDIRKEQQYQREREAAFRDLSEQTNSRAVWWSIVQGVVLVLTGAWQLRSLTVSPPPGRRPVQELQATGPRIGAAPSPFCVAAEALSAIGVSPRVSALSASPQCRLHCQPLAPPVWLHTPLGPRHRSHVCTGVLQREEGPLSTTRRLL